MKSEIITYWSPQQLVDFLRTKPRKAKNRFKGKNGGKCCLGHYAEQCNIPYNPAQGTFLPGGGDGFVGRGSSWSAYLPDDHWLLQRAKIAGPGTDVQMNKPLQAHLAAFNDYTTGYDKVIEAIKTAHPEVV